MANDQVKEILLEQAKILGIQILKLTGNALLKTANELEENRKEIEQPSTIIQS